MKYMGERKKPRNTKPKLAVWNSEISLSLMNFRIINKRWKANGSKNDSCDPIFIERKCAKKECRRLCRVSAAKKLSDEKQEIMDFRSCDKKLFL